MKDSYKELRKKLKNKFDKPNGGHNYEAHSSVGVWVKQCGIRPTATHTTIICKIMGHVPFVYVEADRKKILKYLKKNKYKVFKEFYKELMKPYKDKRKQDEKRNKAILKKEKKKNGNK